MRIPEGGEQTFGLLETDTPKAPVAVGRTLREITVGVGSGRARSLV